MALLEQVVLCVPNPWLLPLHADRSPMEQHHLASAWGLMMKDDLDFLPQNSPHWAQ